MAFRFLAAYSTVEYRKGDRLNSHASPSIARRQNYFTHNPRTQDLNDKLHYGLRKTLCLGWNQISTYFLTKFHPKHHLFRKLLYSFSFKSSVWGRWRCS